MCWDFLEIVPISIAFYAYDSRDEMRLKKLWTIGRFSKKHKLIYPIKTFKYKPQEWFTQKLDYRDHSSWEVYKIRMKHIESKDSYNNIYFH